jgi:hypothetical protein
MELGVGGGVETGVENDGGEAARAFPAASARVGGAWRPPPGRDQGPRPAFAGACGGALPAGAWEGACPGSPALGFKAQCRAQARERGDGRLVDPAVDAGGAKVALEGLDHELAARIEDTRRLDGVAILAQHCL